MSLHAKLKAHLAAHAPTWADDDASARWTDAGGANCLLLVVPRALTAADVVDAHLAAQHDGARATLAFDGAATDVARRTARRLGVELLDAAPLAVPAPTTEAPGGGDDVALGADLPAPLPVEAVVPAPIVAEAFVAEAFVAEAFVAEPALAEPITAEPAVLPEIDAPLVAPAAEPMPAIGMAEPAVEIAGLLPSRFDDATHIAAPPFEAPRVLELVEALVENLSDDEPILLPAPAPMPVIAPVPVAAPAPRRERVYALDMPETLVEVPLEPLAAADGPALPWLVGSERPAPQAPTPVVPTHELAALPWNAPAHPARIERAAETEEEEEGTELLPSGRLLRGSEHPTVLPSWGLPWPRPGAATPALATAESLRRAEPTSWGQAQRGEPLRERLTQIGAPAMGAAKPASSAWLSKLQVERA